MQKFITQLKHWKYAVCKCMPLSRFFCFVGLCSMFIANYDLKFIGITVARLFSQAICSNYPCHNTWSKYEQIYTYSYLFI